MICHPLLVYLGTKNIYKLNSHVYKIEINISIKSKKERENCARQLFLFKKVKEEIGLPNYLEKNLADF